MNANDTLPSLADSFHSDMEREKDTNYNNGGGGGGGGERDLGNGGSRNGWGGREWKSREAPGTAKKERPAGVRPGEFIRASKRRREV